MKFVLSLIICSSVVGECMPPFDWQDTFRTKYDCLTFWIRRISQKNEKRLVEKRLTNGMYIKFYCTPAESILIIRQICVHCTTPRPALVATLAGHS